MNGGRVAALPTGAKGFDTNKPLDSFSARLFVEHGYEFVMRYIPRGKAGPNDLTVREIFTIHGSGLGLGIVQHVESDTSWAPSSVKGLKYAHGALEALYLLGMPRGINVWLDLEGVAPSTSRFDIVDYCNIWYNEVSLVGFIPGLYVGWHCGLGPTALYHQLSFQHYWGAYNLNDDQVPAVRGLQMKQHSAHLVDVPLGTNFAPEDIDLDFSGQDALGGRPLLYLPDRWVGDEPG